MDQSTCLRSDFTKSFHISPVLFCYFFYTGRLHFTYRLLETDYDALHFIHILFSDLLLALYYSIDIIF